MKNEGIILLNLYALIILIILSCIFFTKKRLHKAEDNTYGSLLIFSMITILFGLLLGIFMGYGIPNRDIFILVFNKIYLMGLVITISIFAFYTFCISKNNSKHFDLVKKIYKVLFYINIILITILPLDINYVNDEVVTSGPAMYFTYSVFSVVYLVLVILVLSNVKNIKNKKYIPILILIFEGIGITLIQIFNPALNYIINPSTVLTCLIMYFTIENPDVKMIQQLNTARITAEKANQAKSDFLSSMSHEIRTPLNAIVGFSQMIESENSIDACKEDAKDIVMASQNLLEIVNGILDISKIEANKMEIVNKEYYLLPEMENLSKLMIPRIGEKPIELVTEFASDIPDIMYGDIGKIKQIVTNLLTNSVKYTESGRIEFKIKCVNEKDKCSLVISVADTGRGIKPEKINTLFTKFNRLEEDKNSTIEGTGLGLAITKSLVDMMGGKIVVQSKYGEGSMFIVYLAQKIVKMDAGIDLTTKANELNYDFSGHKILVVDDNKLNLKVAEKILKGFNIEITLVESGFECIDLIKANESYDLILMDDMMPKMKGTETLKKLKELPNFSIPVIALTANALSGIREKYIQDGFNDYLGKPIEKEELVDLLSKYLSKKQTIETQLPKTDVIVEKTNITQPTVAIEQNVNSNGKKILIVDDNKLNIKVASHVMKPYNFVIEEAYSGQECIEKVRNSKYDLIFMDYMMPEMDGIQTLNNLKQLPNFNTPVIALTADSVDGARKRFLDAGFNEYISKPLDKEIFNDVLNKFINNSTNSSNVTVESTKGNINYLKQNGIDVDKGIELLGNEEMYNDILKDFILTIQERLMKLNDFFNKLDMANYAIEVHSLKSDSKYLGFNKLAELSYEHEVKSKANDIEYIKTHYKELLDEFTLIAEILKKY